MGILAECPSCHKKLSVRNKLCSCGVDFDKAKQSKKVKYWINYRLPNGRQKRESVDSFEGLSGFSIEDARKAEGKKRVQKAEKRFLSVPSYDDADCWEKGDYTQRRFLTPHGITQIHTLVREETSAQHKALLEWIIPLIGLIGALTGLLAVILR